MPGLVLMDPLTLIATLEARQQRIYDPGRKRASSTPCDLGRHPQASSPVATYHIAPDGTLIPAKLGRRPSRPKKPRDLLGQIRIATKNHMLTCNGMQVTHGQALLMLQLGQPIILGVPKKSDDTWYMAEVPIGKEHQIQELIAKHHPDLQTFVPTMLAIKSRKAPRRNAKYLSVAKKPMVFGYLFICSQSIPGSILPGVLRINPLPITRQDLEAMVGAANQGVQATDKPRLHISSNGV